MREIEPDHAWGERYVKIQEIMNSQQSKATK